MRERPHCHSHQQQLVVVTADGVGGELEALRAAVMIINRHCAVLRSKWEPSAFRSPTVHLVEQVSGMQATGAVVSAITIGAVRHDGESALNAREGVGFRDGIV
ncbi:hypothetical protein QV65_09885 [Rhodococcus erythropolis]|nr:hypothetical protein QV65_09885 [Rhodococcus erythropolis]